MLLRRRTGKCLYWIFVSHNRAPSGDKPVRGAEIWPSVPGTIQNQHLMSEQNGFGENCPPASGTNQTNKDGDDMDE